MLKFAVNKFFVFNTSELAGLCVCVLLYGSSGPGREKSWTNVTFFFKSQRLLITNLVAFFNGKKATRKLEASL